MNKLRGNAIAFAASFAVLAALAACGDHVENTAVPQAGADSSRPVVDAKAAGDEVGVENPVAAAQTHLHRLGAAGDTSVLDPDVLVSEQVKAALATSPEFGTSSHVDVHTQEGAVTLRGRAPDPSARERATDIARSIPNVKSVDNQLTLG